MPLQACVAATQRDMAVPSQMRHAHNGGLVSGVGRLQAPGSPLVSTCLYFFDNQTKHTQERLHCQQPSAMPQAHGFKPKIRTRYMNVQHGTPLGCLHLCCVTWLPGRILLAAGQQRWDMLCCRAACLHDLVLYVGWVRCRWLDPVIFVMGAAFDTLDVERARVATDTPKREGSIGWSASEDLRLSPWNPKQWASLFLGFHGWRRR